MNSTWLDFQREESAQREGSFNATAMVNAFFSYLEHALALVAAFTEPDSSALNLPKFLGATWGTKFKTIFDLPHHGEAKGIYDRLIQAAETYRNPLAHGGWDKRGPTASVDIEGIGRVPLMISGFEKTVGFKLDVFDPQGFDEVCLLFDKTEELLAGLQGGNALAWIRIGLDVSFAPKERRKYRAEEHDFRKHLDRAIDSWERAENMDW